MPFKIRLAEVFMYLNIQTDVRIYNCTKPKMASKCLDCVLRHLINTHESLNFIFSRHFTHYPFSYVSYWTAKQRPLLGRYQ